MKYDGKIIIDTELNTVTFEKGLKQIGKQVESLNTKGTELGFSLGEAFSTAAGILIASGIDVLLDSIVNAMDDAISRVDIMNNFPNVMANLGVASADAQASIDKMSEALIGLPTMLDEAALGVQRLTAVNGNIKASTEIFLAMNNAVLAGGAPIQQQANAIEQLNQAYAKGKPDMMEWRALLTTMPAQLKQIATAMGYASSNELGEALREGSISMNDFMTTVVKLNKEGIAGFENFDTQARVATNGIATSVMNAKNAVVRGVAEILDAIGRSNIADFILSIGRAIEKALKMVAYFIKALAILFSFGKKGATKKTKERTEDTAISMGSIEDAGYGASKGLDKATGSAKKLNKELKTLSSFDEMDILREANEAASSAGLGGIGGGGALNLDDFDLSDYEEIANLETPKWIKDLKENKDEILRFISIFAAELGGLYIGMKLPQIIEGVKNIFGILQGMSKLQIFSLIGGTATALYGIIKTFVSVKDFIKDPTWNNFKKVLEGILITLTGIGIALTAFEKTTKIGWLLTIVGVLGEVAIKIAGISDASEKAAKSQKKLKDATDALNQASMEYTSAIENQEETEKALTEAEEAHHLSGKKLDELMRKGKLTYKEMTDAQREVYKAYISNEEAISRLDKAESEWHTKSKERKKAESKAAKDLAGEVSKSLGAIEGGVAQASKGIEYNLNHTSGVADKRFKKDIPGSIQYSLNPNLYQSDMNKFSNKWNSFIDGLSDSIVLNMTVTAKAIGLSAIKKLKSAKGSIIYPRLAAGGVVSMPGKGIDYRGANIGERGAEAILPLTDSQQMALLGEAIGKYITVNANITNSMNGRVISRELQKVQSNSDFAYNR